MPDIHLSPPCPADAEALLRFELDNRAFFESQINARPSAYYTPAGVRNAIADAQADAAEDRAYQYLIRDAAGSLVGRVNLSRVRRAHYHAADIGYRMAESACGKGYARQAVGLVLLRAVRELQLLRIEATARPENIGSDRVLRHNGFVPFGHARRSFLLAGSWYDLIHYEWHAPR